MQNKDISLPSNLTSYQKEIERLCFRPDDKDLAKVEILFIFGSSSSLEEMKKAVKQVLSKAKIKTLLISGGVSNKTFPRSEAQVIKDFICDILPKNLEIILEEKATNTLENVLFSKKNNSYVALGDGDIDFYKFAIKDKGNDAFYSLETHIKNKNDYIVKFPSSLDSY